MTSQDCSRFQPILAEGIPNEAIAEVYHRLEDEGSLRWLFFEGDCRTVLEFINLVRSPSNIFYIVIDTEEEDLVGIFWLNSRTKINCSLHMSFFKAYFGRSVDIGIEMIRWIFNTFEEYKSLLSFIPTSNRVANKFTKRVGWIKVGTVPNLIVDAQSSQGVSGNMYYITKEEV
jgi:hypothetical protein